MNSLTLDKYSIVAGETCILNWTLKDSSGSTYDATDWTGKLDISRYEADATALITKTLTFSSVSSVRCKVSATLAPSDTKSLDGVYIYQLTLYDTSSQATVYQGILEIAQNINEAGV